MKFVVMLEATSRQQHDHHLRWQNLQMKKSNMGELTLNPKPYCARSNKSCKTITRKRSET